jgi:hypothetical protein
MMNIQNIEHEIRIYLAEQVALHEFFRLNPGVTRAATPPIEPHHMTDWLLRLRRVKLEAAVNLTTFIAKSRVARGEPEDVATETALWIFRWWFENSDGTGLSNFVEWMDDTDYELQLSQSS